MSKIGASELIINGDGSVFHLHIRPENLADKVILVGDPGRVELVGSFFSSKESSTSSREFRSITGIYKGTRMTVLSTGIGCDNIDIVMNELDALANIDFGTREVRPQHRRLTVLRIGTCGVIRPEIRLGSYVFSEVSAGFDGLLNWYGGRDNVALKDVEEAFLSRVKWNGYLPTPYFVRAADSLKKLFEGHAVMGMTVSAPGFYGPQWRQVRLPLEQPDMLAQLRDFEYNGLRFTNIEMEGSAIAGLAGLLGHDAATVCLGIAHRYAKDAKADYKSLMGPLVELCLNLLAK